MKALYLFTALNAALLLGGCIKEPGTPPPPPRPQWLISKMIMITQTGSQNPFPGEPSARYRKLVWEIRYNQYYKPVALYVYTSSPDTTSLQLAIVDTLLYDARYRVKQLDAYMPGRTSVQHRRKFSYLANDTLPSLIQNYSTSYSDTLTLALTSEIAYAYIGDTVRAITGNPKSGPDTIKYVYTNGNFTHYYSPGGFREDLFTEYDNGPALERFMNLSQGMVFELPMSYVNTPRLSRGNWKGAGPQMWQKYIYYYANGLISHTEVMEFDPISSYKMRLEYIETKP